MKKHFEANALGDTQGSEAEADKDVERLGASVLLTAPAPTTIDQVGAEKTRGRPRKTEAKRSPKKKQYVANALGETKGSEAEAA